MKKLSEYFFENNYVVKQLARELLIHEAFDDNVHIYHTFESIGLFKGCKEIIKYIAETIKFTPNNKWIIKANEIASDLFFDKLILYTNDNHENFYGEYKIGYVDDDKNNEYHQKQWNYEKQQFNFIEITLYNIKDASYTDIYEILTHELTHAWDDYILNKTSGSTLRNKKLDNKFEQEVKELSEKIKLSRWLDFKNIDKYDEYLSNDVPYIKTILYFLDKTETNAYIAQINQVLKDKHFETPSEIVHFLNNNCVTYYNYKTIYELFNNEQYINKLIEIGIKKSSAYHFKKIVNKAWDKIINHIYHILLNNKPCCIKEDIFLRIDDLLKPIWER